MFFEGNVTIEWEGGFGRDVHQKHAELVLEKCFLRRRLLTKKNKKLNSTPQKFNIALEKRWLAFLLGPGNCSGFMLNFGGGGYNIQKGFI